MALVKVRAGDWIGTVGAATWRRPQLIPVYWGIRRFARERYPDPLDMRILTHARVAIGNGQFYEMTWPVSRIGSFYDSRLASKFADGRVYVARWPNVRIDSRKLRRQAERRIGRKYDAGDIADYALTWFLGAWNMLLTSGPFGVFGDRAQRFGTCAVEGIELLMACGVPLPPGYDKDGFDPNTPFNVRGTVADETAKWYPQNITHQLTTESFT